MKVYMVLSGYIYTELAFKLRKLKGFFFNTKILAMERGIQ